MPDNSLSTCETALRSAIVQGRYADAQAHLEDYCRAVTEMWQGRTAPAPHDAEIAAGVLRLLEWARHMTLSGKTQIAAEVRQLHSLRRYRPARPGASVQTLAVEA